jgi:hypothetical protein
MRPSEVPHQRSPPFTPGPPRKRRRASPLERRATALPGPSRGKRGRPGINCNLDQNLNFMRSKIRPVEQPSADGRIILGLAGRK